MGHYRWFDGSLGDRLLAGGFSGAASAFKCPVRMAFYDLRATTYVPQSPDDPLTLGTAASHDYAAAAGDLAGWVGDDTGDLVAPITGIDYPDPLASAGILLPRGVYDVSAQWSVTPATPPTGLVGGRVSLRGDFPDYHSLICGPFDGSLYGTVSSVITVAPEDNAAKGQLFTSTFAVTPDPGELSALRIIVAIMQLATL